jgi:hypothetical protein
VKLSSQFDLEFFGYNMAEEVELPEGMVRHPAESEIQQTKNMVSLTMMSDMITALEEGKLSLTMAVKSLKEQLDQQKQDQQDIYYYLNKKCDDSYEVIATLEEQLLTEQGDREVAEKMYEDRLASTTLAFEMEEGKLKHKISKQLEKISGLDKFLDMKEDMEDELAAMKATLEKEREQNKTVLKELELSWAIERDKLKKAYDRDLEALRVEMDNKLVSKMSNKTKDIHQRNLEMSSELSHQSKQADQVLIYNQITVDKDRQLRVDLELATSAEEEMGKKLGMYQRMIKDLNSKMESMAADHNAIIDERIQFEEIKKKLDDENSRLMNINKHGQNYKAGKIIQWMLSTLRDLIGETAYSEIIEEKNGLLRQLQNEADVGKKHEVTLLKIIKTVVAKHPELGLTHNSATAPISFFPAVSPKPGFGAMAAPPKLSSTSPVKSSGLSLSPKRKDNNSAASAFSFKKSSSVTIATQTDEQRDPLQSDSMWLTRGHKSSSPSNGNDHDEEKLFQGGNWADNQSIDSTGHSIDQSIINQMSIKSTSAIPHKPNQAWAAPKGRKLNSPNVEGTGSLDGRISTKNIKSMLQVQHRKPLKVMGTPSKIVSRDEAYNYHNDSDSIQGRHSPQSSISFSPRGGNDDDTINTLSPRTAAFNDSP